MKLKHKLPLAFTVVLLVAVSGGAFGIYKLSRSNADYADVIGVELAHERAVAAMGLGFKTQIQEWKNTLLRGANEKTREKHWSAFQKSEAEVARHADELVAALPQGEERRLVEAFAQAHAAMGDKYRTAYGAFQAANFDPVAGDSLVKGMDRAPSELLEAVGEKIAGNAKANVVLIHRGSSQAVGVSLVVLLVVVIGGAITGIVISRSVTRQLGGDPAYAVEAARRDFTQPVTLERGIPPACCTRLM